MLTEAQMTDCRRYMGYQAVGTTMVINEKSDLVYASFGMVTMSLYTRLTTLTASEEAVLIGYIGQCATLEAAILSSSDNLDTDAAAVWTHNKNEIHDRSALYSQWRHRLCDFLGFPAGKGIGCGASVRLVRS